MTLFTDALAVQLMRTTMGHVERPYPYRQDQLLASADDLREPRELHPIFCGSLAWHACVQGYWTMARLWRRFPALDIGTAVGHLFERRITSEAVAAELAYLERPAAQTFERPYGWAWLLALQAELDSHPQAAAQAAGAALLPLGKSVGERLHHYLGLADYPVRSGTHDSSAFALRMAADYAARHDAALLERLRERAWHWYGDDRAAQAWEPGQEDFLSPTLMEAECLRHLLPAERFVPWFGAFLPMLGERQPQSLFTPARVSDRSDPGIARLDALNLSRAWCMRALAAALPKRDEAISHLLENTAQAHVVASLAHVMDHDAGGPWLATFVVLALDDFSAG